MKCCSYSSAVARYGRIHLAPPAWPGELKWMATLSVPDEIGRHWINTVTGAITKRIYCNKDIHAPLHAVFANLVNDGLVHELKTFDGCFNIRAVRGEGGVSAHAYGLAIDLNAKENPLGGVIHLSHDFVQCWTRAGFDWGGKFGRRDGMHFSYCWEGCR